MTDQRFEHPERSENPAHSGPKNDPSPAAADSSSANEQPTVIPAGGVLPTRAPASGELLTGTPSEPHSAAVPGAAAATPSTSHPSHFGRYRVEKRLGRGGFGEVYQAWDEQLNRPVAIKITFQQFLTSGGKASYLAEAQTVASLDHPQIVPVFDVGQTATGDYFVVSKLVEGADLAVRIAKQRPARSESVNMVISIAEALQHAHSKGLVHRDVKPANILIDSQGRAFLTDFGIALREVDFGKQQGAIGTPGYMSPEQARGEGHRVDGRSDLYSLGVVLYELLTGRRPFQSDDMLDLMLRIAESEVRPPRQLDPSIPRELERICLKALALRASDRYPTCSDFAEDLRYLAEQEAARPRSASGSSSAERPQADDQEHSPHKQPNAASASNSQPANAAVTGQASSTPSPQMPVSPTPFPTPAPTPTPTGPTRVVPRGLRSFDQSDADFFLELLPGPVDRMGLPDNLRFWKSRIETTNGEQSFSVGLIYGPSGCGKSSLVKAGLMPRLADTVLPIYLEATGDDTEPRLARAIRKKIPALGSEGGLRDTLTKIRRGERLPPGKSLLLIIDQFEQWLHAHCDYRNTELTTALRQCDGQQIRCIVMVRDDFWLSVSRFMRELEVDIEASNSRLVDLFDLDHAARVLGLFGRAFNKLPDSSSQWTKDQHDFILQSVAGLAQERKVVSVRLALFAEMMKSRDWTPAALKEVGGTEGVGTTFLEETFSSRTAPPQYRHHQAAARAVLAALLPDSTTDIKGQMRSQAELQEAAGYVNRPSDFRDLLRILDSELRLITPTDVETGVPGEGRSLRSVTPGSTSGTASAAGDNSSTSTSTPTRHYQLTHDYLVPSLRDWLTRKQRETRTGRAELKLAERTALWTAKPENRHLPSLTEWVSIWWLLKKNRWTESQRLMMHQGRRLHLKRTVAQVLFLVMAAIAVQFILAGQKAVSLVQSLKTASPQQLIPLVEQADSNLRSLDRLLRPLIEQGDAANAEAAAAAAALPARLVLVKNDVAQIEPLSEMLLDGDLDFVEPIRTRLRMHADALKPKWLEVLRNAQDTPSRRFRAALGLAGIFEGGSTRTDLNLTDGEYLFIAERFTASISEHQPQLRNLLRPIRSRLVPALSVLFDDEGANADQQINSAMALNDYAGENAEFVTQLLIRANARQTEILFPRIAHIKNGPAREQLLALTKEQPAEQAGQLERVRLGRRRANAAITLLRQGEREAWFDALRISDDPESLSQFVARCHEWGVTPTDLIESLQRSVGLRQSGSGSAKQAESRVIYGLLVALGGYSLDQIPKVSQEGLFDRLRELYNDDASGSVHSASGWLLRHWGRTADVQKLDEQEVPYDPSGERNWFRLRLQLTPKANVEVDDLASIRAEHSISLTFIVFPAGEYHLGSPEHAGGELDRTKDEVPRFIRITRPVALCDREVTWALYDLFDGGRWRNEVKHHYGWALSDDDAVVSRNWYEWVEFCRWLTSERDGGDESSQCYPDSASLQKDGYENPIYGGLPLDRDGFRMPTESEWELGARSGQRTAYAFGGDTSLLSDYGWFIENSGKRPHRTAAKRPTIGGLFDAHGNLYEWTHDWKGDNNAGSVQVDPIGASTGSSRMLRGGCWTYDAANCRSANRVSTGPALRSGNDGFRIALSLPPRVSSTEFVQQLKKNQAQRVKPSGEAGEGMSAEQ